MRNGQMNINKRQILLVLIIAAFVITSGCVQKSAGQQKAAQVAFAGGSAGLDLAFLPSQPPTELPENTEFTIALKLENKGEADVSAARVILSGFDIKSFAISNDGTTSTDEITGVERIQNTVVPGGQKIITFNGVTRDIEVGASADFVIRATVIYPYQTTAISTVCLKENLVQQSVGGSEICKITGAKTVENSGAPVKVTTVEQNPNGFLIKVKNVGTGAAFVRAGNTANKESEIGLNEVNRISISAEIGNGEISVTCSPTTLFLQNNEGQVFCSAPLVQAGRGEFTDLLTITLNYGYVSKVNTNLRVLNLGAGTPTSSQVAPATENQTPSAPATTTGIALPDLVVENIQFTPVPPFGPNQQFSIAVEFKNQGQARATLNLVTVRLELDGQTPRTYTGTSGQIDPAGTYAFGLGSFSYNSTGTYSAKATVDSENKIPESNENNNIKAVQFGVF